MSATSMQFSERDRLLPAFGMALCLHIALVLFWPYLNHVREQPPLRFEIELTQPAAKSEEPSQQAAVSPPPEATPVVPSPKVNRPKQTQPILTAKKSSPDSPQDFVVPDSVFQTQQSAVTANAAPTIPSETKALSAETQATAATSSESARIEEAEPTEAWNGYGQMLYDMVSKNKTYPAIAVRRNWEGRVKIIARFDQGKLISASIMEAGSGHQVLDDAALDMLRKAVNAMPVRGKLANKIFTVVIPLDFKIEG